MKRSEIEALIQSARDCFAAHGWTLPPIPRWDVTDFGIGDWREFGLVLVNLAEEAEYCEKLMYAQAGMKTPAHCHRTKKEDIIARWGTLRLWLWSDSRLSSDPVKVKIDGEWRTLPGGEPFDLEAGSRITLEPGIYHEFAPASEECIIGEVSTANDDLHDNFFSNPQVGRFPGVLEDVPATVRLLRDSA